MEAQALRFRTAACLVSVFVVLGAGMVGGRGFSIYGAIIGIGVVKGVRTIDGRVVLRVTFGWLGTPAIAWGISVGFSLLARGVR